MKSLGEKKREILVKLAASIIDCYSVPPKGIWNNDKAIKSYDQALTQLNELYKIDERKQFTPYSHYDIRTHDKTRIDEGKLITLLEELRQKKNKQIIGSVDNDEPRPLGEQKDLAHAIATSQIIKGEGVK